MPTTNQPIGESLGPILQPAEARLESIENECDPQAIHEHETMGTRPDASGSETATT
jgi:hypothetical protein